VENFPSNSFASQRQQEEKPKKTSEEERPKVEKIIEGKAIRRKKPLGVRFTEMFFGDATKNSIDYAIKEVLVPAFRDTVVDALTEAIQRRILGDSLSRSRRSSSYYRPGHTSYDRISRRPSPSRREENDDRYTTRRVRKDFEDVVLGSRAEALNVIDRMDRFIELYQVATVGDLYNLVGEPASHVHEKWGWTTMEGVSPRRVGDGWLVDLPAPDPVS